jgi:hypothetical protein
VEGNGDPFAADAGEMTTMKGRELILKRILLLALIAGLAALAVAPGAWAEEGGSGHYMPGSISSFVDAVPPEEAFIVRYNMLYYSGEYNRAQPLPIAGLTAAGVEANPWIHALTLAWRPPLEIGEDFSYAVSATIPYMFMDISADVTTGAGNIIRQSDSENGLGDIVVMPLMLNYAFNPDFNANLRLGVYAPSGDFKQGRLANTGKNFWTVEPTLGLVYFGQKNGREAALYAGADFNTENEDTDYHSGTQAHLDGTLAQHLPMAGGIAGAGVSGHWYKQVEGDSGAGATFGDFKAMSVGVGPAISYVYGKLIAELKWLHEFDTERRLEGDIVWLKVVGKF